MFVHALLSECEAVCGRVQVLGNDDDKSQLYSQRNEEEVNFLEMLFSSESLVFVASLTKD
jgi:hypothetical protein